MLSLLRSEVLLILEIYLPSEFLEFHYISSRANESKLRCLHVREKIIINKQDNEIQNEM